MTGARTFGAPGVYRESDEPLRRLTGVRMDVCGFVGVAPRGPAREPARESPWPAPSASPDGSVRRSVPVPVESWTEYVQLFGGFSGPGLLPYAVHSFFRQGGRRAWVVRVVPAYGDSRDREGRASAPLTGLHSAGRRGLPLRSARVGADQDGIRVRVDWPSGDLGLRGILAGGFAVAPDAEVEVGDLLRVELKGGNRRFHRVESVRGDALAGSPVRVAVPVKPPEGEPVSVERVRMDLTVEGVRKTERFEGLGLTPVHPDWAGRVLSRDSEEVHPDRRWLERELRPASPSLPTPGPGAPFRGGGDDRPSRGAVPGVQVRGDGLWLEARSEGRWGRRLRASLSFTREPVELVQPKPSGSTLLAAPDSPTPVGATLVLDLGGGRREVRTVVDVSDGWKEAPPRVRTRRLALDRAPSAPPAGVDRVEAELRVREVRGSREDGPERRERIDGLGLSPEHPRWMHEVLRRESTLIRPHGEWRSADLELTDELLDGPGPETGPFHGGRDRYRDIRTVDFFDDEWSAADERQGDGIQALGGVDELALLVVPDLYRPEPELPEEDVTETPSLAGPAFAPCVDPGEPVRQGEERPALQGLHLDPDAQLDRIVALQRRVVDLADTLRRFVALLDVPPGLAPDEILRWRGHFGTDFAAAYHPWTDVTLPEDGRSEPVRVNPSGVAAGIIARTEADQGVHQGPANVRARGVVRLAEEIAPRHHDLLHPRGVNVFRRDSSGIRLTGARTLSRDPAYRQLSVRRLMSMLARTLEREMAWTAFEPNSRTLRGQVRRLLTGFLRRLYRANALRGATEDEAFFVRCDETVNPPRVVDDGRLVAEVGVAPAEPAEYLVLRIARDPDGSVRAEA